ncbi:MAG: B12-binding domain-containing radical SAM protein, partial [Desulfitobacterium sp.]|nr:B12-binding domain-containing radical SAM protein [Desulfitobacterium sp.]
RKLNVSYSALTILTPLPGTTLYEQTKDRLLTNDPEFFDFMHTVLPTTLPLKEFYNEYANTILKATPTFRYWKFISKFEFKRRLPYMMEMLRVLKDIREGYKWHESSL